VCNISTKKDPHIRKRQGFNALFGIGTMFVLNTSVSI
jgi:hypothetical protein